MTIRRILLNDLSIPDDLRTRLLACGKPIRDRWGYCRQVGCDRCRRYRARQWADEVEQEFGDHVPARLRRLDIAIGTVGRTTEIIPVLRSARKRLRNVVARLRLSNRHARALCMTGGFLIDRQESRWAVSLCAVIHLGRLNEVRLSDMIERLWHGRALARLSPFERADIPGMITAVLDFPNAEKWDRAEVTELFTLFAMATNFAVLRFKLRPSCISAPDAFVELVNASRTSQEWCAA